MAVPDLTRRALPHELPERMDQPCTFEQLNGCLRDIAWVNRLTFAYRPTLSWLSRLPAMNRPLRIVDVGCGYGDMLRRVDSWAKQCGLTVSLTGIDLNPDAIRAAQAVTLPQQNIRFVAGDAFSAELGEIDVVVSSLLTHHLEEPEIVRFLAWMEATTRVGWFVNDLHRKSFPYRAFRAMAAVLPLHPFPQHDGLVSIRRSFRREDWERLCAAAGVGAEARIVAYRPARLCVGRVKKLL